MITSDSGFISRDTLIARDTSVRCWRYRKVRLGCFLTDFKKEVGSQFDCIFNVCCLQTFKSVNRFWWFCFIWKLVLPGPISIWYIGPISIWSSSTNVYDKWLNNSISRLLLLIIIFYWKGLKYFKRKGLIVCCYKSVFYF